MLRHAVTGYVITLGAIVAVAAVTGENAAATPGPGPAAIRSVTPQGSAAGRLQAGEARIWYLGHCGFAVRTAGHLLIFDYQERRDGQEPRVRPDKPGLDRGWLDPAEIRDERVRVFASHSHEDHFDPVVFTWRPAVPDIKYFFGWKAADDPAYHYLVGPRATYSADGLEILTVNSHHSGVPEVAFLVKVDGLTVYHNGDYQMDYQADFPYLQTHAPTIDLMFVPPVAREDLKYAIQNKDLFERFRPKAVFPMHAAAGAQMYREFADAFRLRVPGLPIMIPERLGDRFDYVAGRINRSPR